jgi:hypothetical protein
LSNEELFKELIWDVVLAAVLGALTASLPGWVSTIIISIVKGFTDKLFGGLTLMLEMDSARIKNNDFRVAFNAAAVRLKLVAQQKGIDSPEFRKERNEHKKALQALANANWPKPTRR